jgi:hypothetical protein
MRMATSRRRRVRVATPRAVGVSLPPPVGGWNTRDSFADMNEKDAVVLDNWVAAPGYCYVRKGYSEWATGLPDQVETLIEYASGTTTELWAVSDGSVYDITSSGAVGSAVVTGLATSVLQHENISTAGGSFIYAAGDGGDKPLLYDGSTWTAIDAASSPAITGVTTTNLTNPVLFKTRLFFIEKNTLSAWYLPSGAIAGAAAEVDMSAYARRGGSLLAAATWTIDAGYGVDDYLVFVTSNGEVIVWRGTDPSSSTTWTMTGVWRIGSPVGRRCLTKWSGDLLVITNDGIFSMAAALTSSRVQSKDALTDLIRPTFTNSVSLYGGNTSWEITPFPTANLMIVNVPVSAGSQQQYVMHLVTKRWSRFTGLPANCWLLHNDRLFFGGDSTVYLAWETSSDNGDTIQADALQAFNYFGQPGKQKQFTLMRQVFRTTGSPTFLSGINVDFDTTVALGSPIYSPPSETAVWGTAKWGEATWGAGTGVVLQQWVGIDSIGYSGAPSTSVVTNSGDTFWMASDISFLKGGLF